MTRKLKQLKGMAWSYTWIHRENSTYLNDMYEWISVISYSLSFFNGVILIFPNNIIYIRIFNILLAFSAGLLVFYIKNKKFPETAERHKIASSKFSNIYNNISRQLSLDISLREAAVAYHRWITAQYENLYGTAPDIDPPIIEEYVRKFAHKRKFNPIEAAEFDRQSSSNNISSSYSSFSSENENFISEEESTSSDHHVIEIYQDNDSNNSSKNGKKDKDNDNNSNHSSNHNSSNHDSSNHNSSNHNSSSYESSTHNSSNHNSNHNNSVNEWDINIQSPSTQSDSPSQSESSPPSESSRIISDELNSENLNKINNRRPKKKSRRKRHIDYERERFNQNNVDFMNVTGMGMSTKCLIPEFQLYRQEQKASTPSKRVTFGKQSSRRNKNNHHDGHN